MMRRYSAATWGGVASTSAAVFGWNRSRSVSASASGVED